MECQRAICVPWQSHFGVGDWQDFAKPAPYTIGNAPRPLSWVHNPNSQIFDFSLTKNTRFGDRYNVQIRMEMFDALNHPVLGSVDSNFGDQTFDTNGNRTGTPASFSWED